MKQGMVRRAPPSRATPHSKNRTCAVEQGFCFAGCRAGEDGFYCGGPGAALDLGAFGTGDGGDVTLSPNKDRRGTACLPTPPPSTRAFAPPSELAASRASSAARRRREEHALFVQEPSRSPATSNQQANAAPRSMCRRRRLGRRRSTYFFSALNLLNSELM